MLNGLYTDTEYNEKISAYLTRIGHLMGILKTKKNNNSNGDNKGEKSDSSDCEDAFLDDVDNNELGNL